MDYYTLDKSKQPLPCDDVLKYMNWHTQMPESADWYHAKTGLGFQIASTTLQNGKRVSTVYLGMNHGFDGKVLLWETMVFPGCEICERYETYEEAINGHAMICAEVSGS